MRKAKTSTQGNSSAKKSTIKKFIKIFIITLFTGILAVFGLFIGSIFGLLDSNLGIDLDSVTMNFSSIVYYTDAEGKPVEFERLYDSQNRVWADISIIPKYMQDALVSIEDERFEKHNGIDIPRSAKAAFTYLFKGSSSFGGSTITQQLVKNMTGDKKVNPSRKIREMYRALILEKKLSKEQILELYLNTIFLSNNCNGVQAAANKYFGKDVSELTLAQCASIAGITQYPTLYDPLSNPEKNIEKQRIVLKKMLELKKITQEEYDNALNEKLVFLDKSSGNTSSKQSYFTDQLINDVLDDLQTKKGYSKAIAEKMIYTGGLKIYATVDPSVQNAMDEVYQNKNNFPKANSNPEPQSAMVVLDPYAGAIRGIVGGIGEKSGDRVLNRASQSLRQPGSCMKPIGVYAPSIELGLVSPGSVVVDEPIDINGWKPINYYNGFRGSVTVRDAVAHSMNIPAVKVLQRLTVDYSFNFLKKNLGITSLVESEKRSDGKTYTDKNLSSLALGGLTDGISLTELAAAYTPFVNSGLYSKPHTYTKVLDSNDNIILENKVKTTVAMSEQTAYLTNSMLQTVVKRGTAPGAKLASGMPSAGKTGTTDEDKDRWYAGFTPYYVGVVWYGYDKPQPLSFLNYHPCVPIWKKVMDKIHNSTTPVTDFKKPQSGITEVKICLSSGKLATELCVQDPDANVINEIYKSSMAPKDYCTVHDQEPEESPTPDGEELPLDIPPIQNSPVIEIVPSLEPNTKSPTPTPTPTPTTNLTGGNEIIILD